MPPPSQAYPAEPPQGERVAVAYDEASADASAHEHQGFLFQFLLGAAYLTASETISDSYGRSQNNKYSGYGAAISAAVGWTIARNLVILGRVSGSNTLKSDCSPDCGSSLDLILIGFGPGIAYYLESANVHFSGVLTLSRLSFEDRYSGYKDNTDFGVGGTFVVGKEWWTGRHLGLGAAAQVQAAIMNDSFYDTSLTAISLSALLSVTVN
jgi:hypothetical protein